MRILWFTLLVFAGFLPLAAQETKTESTQESHSSDIRKSVTTTSDGKTTVRTTVTVENGIRKVVTETIDEKGELTRKEETTPPEETSGVPWIGLRVTEVPAILRDQLDLAEDEGLVVELVAKESPASRAKIHAGDLLLALGGSSVSTSEALTKELSKHKAGDQTRVTIMRKAKRVVLPIELEKAPRKKLEEAPEGVLDGFQRKSVKSVEMDVGGEVIDSLLDDPDLPESFKKSIREMQKSLREFEKKNR